MAVVIGFAIGAVLASVMPATFGTAVLVFIGFLVLSAIIK